MDSGVDEDSVGMVVSSSGRDVEVLVKSREVELGSILRIGDFYGIVAGMRYVEDEKIGSKQKLIADTQVFGRIADGRLKRIKRPVEPYAKACLATKEELEVMLKREEEISLGVVYGTNARAYLSAREYDRHMAILASTGAGKSYTAANLVGEFSRIGLPVIIVDTHGEYQRLLSKLAEKKPLDITVYTVGRRRQGASELKIPVSDLAPEDFQHFVYLTEPQESALGLIIDKISGTDYLLEDVIRECASLDPEVIHEGTIQALKRKLKTLERVFRNVFDKYGTDISHLVEPHKITIIDSSLSSQAVRRAVISYLSKELLQGRIASINDLEGTRIGYPLLFVVEEAHNYAGDGLSHSCKRELQRIASEGRKFGVGLCVISQKPSKIDEEILSQCNTGLYMHITNPNDKNHIKKSFECINDAIISDLDSLDVGECIIAGAMLDLPFLMCRVDEIVLGGDRKPKFVFKKPIKVESGGFEYA